MASGQTQNAHRQEQGSLMVQATAAMALLKAKKAKTRKLAEYLAFSIWTSPLLLHLR